MRKTPELVEIRNERLLCPEKDKAFFDMLQEGLLLALMEQGILNAMQYRQAAEMLKQQHRARAEKKQVEA